MIARAVPAAVALWSAREALADAPLIHDFRAYQAGEYGLSPNQSYHTLNSTSPLWQINTWEKEAVDDSPYVFTNFCEDFDGLMTSSSTPMIFSSEDLSLIWAGSPTPLGYTSIGSKSAPTALNPLVQSFRGEQYLTYWGGANLRDHGLGKGHCFMFNSRYELEHVIEAVDVEGARTNSHSCLITPGGEEMMIAIYDNSTADLTSVGGPKNGTLLDGLMQVVDIETKELRFQWRSSDYYPLNASYVPWAASEVGYDWFHMNSVQATSDGNYLISSRVLSSVSYVNGTNGDVIWTLGGKLSDFAWEEGKYDGEQAFMYQHNVHVNEEQDGYGMSRIYMFDNQYPNTTVGCTANCSRALVLDMDYDNMSYKVLSSYPHPKSVDSASQGNHYRLPGDSGNSLVGWGANPGIIEYSQDGTAVFDVQFGILGYGPDAYRVYKEDWVGVPTWDPALVVVEEEEDKKTAWVSWNGATEVREWVLTGAASKKELQMQWPKPSYKKRANKAGFEMSFEVPNDISFLQVVALDSEGVELRKSDVVAVVASGPS